MRKTIVTHDSRSEMSQRNWLDVEQLAQVEITSEEAGHPIEFALHAGHPEAWRASERGVQTIRLHFDPPQRLKLVRLVFEETKKSRTQEFVLRWHAPDERASHDIVRQQYTFSPPETTREIEEYTVALHDVSVLELQIVPDISGSEARASLSEWLLA